MTEAFGFADDVLRQGVQGIRFNNKRWIGQFGFCRCRSVMANKGKAVMGTGLASGENRARHAQNRLCIALCLMKTIEAHAEY
ncbi:MAG: hypothetical protein Ct9H300mP21_01620 [Pseudomonadota bacterium]|nr:MAG: hypothetical protein Ct9H300mP21_01620 [Pseudomonadota bacterium]